MFILRIKRWDSKTRKILYVTESQLKKIKNRVIRHGFTIISINPVSINYLYNLHKKNNNIASGYFRDIKMNMLKRNPMFVRRG